MSGRSLLRALGALVLALFLAAAFTPLPNHLNRAMGLEPDLGPAQAIVVLGSGVHADGVLSDRSLVHELHGIALWRQSLAPLLVLSGPSLAGRSSEAQIRAALASTLGLPSDAVVADSGGRTTRGEAESIRRRLAPMGVDRILLVTDRRHLVRARRAFEETGFEVRPAPPPDFLGGARSPQERLQLTRRLTEEWLARAYYAMTGSSKPRVLSWAISRY